MSRTKARYCLVAGIVTAVDFVGQLGGERFPDESDDNVTHESYLQSIDESAPAMETELPKPSISTKVTTRATLLAREAAERW
ncbi:hypothetical protein B296_00052332 [Ensete ventricosum]|uniref:Uncharacterized protein n=1 Tax=Ensete ventricosum TaxID=4639 RepID=A0A426X364_ENSVE|nr:hypothetical protein B296_00052332 [Ensete ventricosum]